jgi:RHS repeat-associated protein
MLYGLDLISQDDGNETRYLLADGLGSVRIEMTDDTVATATTYEPFGKVLQQAGNSGTVYGFTGEQYDTSTEQLYLRARYYNPGLHTFMGKDPWNGNPGRPQSMNGWSYVDNNSVNLTDPTGMFPDYCHRAGSAAEYEDCVRDYYHLRGPAPYYGPVSLDFQPFFYDGCYYGPVPYVGTGYIEGRHFWGGPVIGYSGGTESVYDFAKMEQRNFKYQGFGFQDLIGVSGDQYAGMGYGFTSWLDIATDYSDWFVYGGPGVSAGYALLGVSISAATGGIAFASWPDVRKFVGEVWYIGASVGVDPLSQAAVGFPVDAFTDFGVGWTKYSPAEDPSTENYYYYLEQTIFVRNKRRVEEESLYSDIMNGTHGVWHIDFSWNVHANWTRKFGQKLAVHWAKIYNAIHLESFPE